MMYVPKGWHWLGPVGIVLIGFYVRTHFGAYWDVFVFVQLPLCLIASEWGAYIWQAGVAYQNYLTGKPAAPPEEKKLPLINLFTGQEIPREEFEIEGTKAFAEVVELPRFSAERHFAVDVLRMYDMDPDTQKFVDLTEERWVIQKKQFTQKPFANMKKKWEHFGVLKRKNQNKNSPYVVSGRAGVALIASGNPLPEWRPPLSE